MPTTDRGASASAATDARIAALDAWRGATPDDSTGQHDASLEVYTRRSIEPVEEDDIDEPAFTAFVRAAVGQNAAGDAERSIATDGGEPSDTSEPKLLSGGNPQIPKADGDEPVQAYIAAMPGWKHDVGRRLDDLVEDTVPNVRKAVRWNSPFYGIEGQGWLLSFHCFTNYVKVTFFRGTSLEPVPPVESTQDEVRYAHIHEDEEIDEERWVSWIEQAAALPGAELF